MRTKRFFPAAIAAVGVAALALGADAQESTNVPAATLPGPGLVMYRSMVRYESFDGAPGGGEGETDRLRFMHHVTYGIRPELGAFAEVSVVDRDIDSPAGEESDTGLTDSRLGLLYRFYRHDFGPIETVRVSAEASVRLPTGTDEFSSDTVNPALGLRATSILGRHGINAAARYELTTGESDDPLDAGDTLADSLMLSGGHLYRLWPASFVGGGSVALYSQVELLGQLETNGDASLDGAIGLLVEAPRWAAEMSVILPIAEDLEDRPDLEYGLAIGVRFLF